MGFFDSKTDAQRREAHATQPEDRNHSQREAVKTGGLTTAERNAAFDAALRKKAGGK